MNGFQTTQVSAPTFESIRFANKTSVTIIGNGGADTLTFNNPTPAAGLSTLNVTNVGAVTQTGAVNYTNLSLNNVTGAVTLTGSNDVTSLSALLTGSGNGFSFNDVDDIALTSVGLVNGISTSNGAIAITTAVGPIIVVNTASGTDVNAGAGTVALTAGSFGATDFFIQLQPGANVTGLAGVQLRADNIDLATGATVNAGSRDRHIECVHTCDGHRPWRRGYCQYPRADRRRARRHNRRHLARRRSHQRQDRLQRRDHAWPE